MFNAKKIAAQLKRNVKNVNSGAITYEEFHVRQRKAWDCVAQGEMNITGSACAERHDQVSRLLGFHA